MNSQVLLQVPFLSELRATNIAFKWLFARMHPSVVEEVPGLDEFFVAAGVSAVNDSLSLPWALTG